MQKRLALLIVYLCLLPCVLLAFTGYLLVTIHLNHPKQEKTLTKSTQFQSPPKQMIAASYTPQGQEARIEVLKEFFKRYNSPLLSHAELIVTTADKYSLDWKLVPAIAMQESTLCKKIPKNSFNCWGFGIYGGKITRFANYDEAIETVTKTLAREYKEKRGLEEPHEIVTRYTPGSGTWADKVTLVMNTIQNSL
ncbi:MAG TPA: hypothetical protein PKA38_05125 [Candidatus Levybacteria bacterium]|nr:hypothetical protein [Candidatus Levybacteria bacterium]